MPTGPHHPGAVWLWEDVEVLLRLPTGREGCLTLFSRLMAHSTPSCGSASGVLAAARCSLGGGLLLGSSSAWREEGSQEWATSEGRPLSPPLEAFGLPLPSRALPR